MREENVRGVERVKQRKKEIGGKENEEVGRKDGGQIDRKDPCLSLLL